jgi:DNA repair photolyase
VEWLGPPPDAALEVHEERARSILSRNESPDVPFRWSLNPYRGCVHACAYCYARPTHQYLDWGAGTDFDRRIVVKTNAPELLATELARPSMAGETLCMSGNTDCYQGLEASYRLTQRCLEVARARGNPVTVITKAALVRRDAELLARLARGPGARVYVSLAFTDGRLARAIEPGASSPDHRLAAMRALREAGVPVGVAVSPVIPGLNDEQVAGVLEAAVAAGADRAFLTMLRLPREVRPVFEERLRAALPGRADRVLSAFGAVRSGGTDEARFGRRMVGTGPRWEIVERLYEVTCRRLGIDGSVGEGPRHERALPTQGSLFDE